MKINRTKGVCFILALLLIVSISGTAMAALSRQTLELEVNSGVTVYLNEQEIQTGGNGELEAFVHEGRTYLPIRAISEAIGMDITWDSETGSVFISDGSQPTANDGNAVQAEPILQQTVNTAATASTDFNLESRTVTLNNGVEMPVLGIGTFMLEPEQAEESVYHALMDGYRLIDTANAYMNERAVGRAIKRSGVPREEIFVTTKLWVSVYEDAENAIDETLARLDLEYIDLLLLHQPYGDYLGAYQAMENAVREGKIRSIGLSNFYEKTFDEIMSIATITPAVVQNEVNPFYQQVEMREYMRPYGTVLMAWFPLGGRGNTQTLFNHGTVAGIAEAHGKTSAQVVLRWHMQSGIIAIPGSSNPDHILENISIFDFELTDDEMQRLRILDTGSGAFDYSSPEDDDETGSGFLSFSPDFNDQP